MTVAEIFERMDYLNSVINAKVRLVSALRDTLSIGAPPTDAEHVSHTRNVHAMQDRIAAIVDAERETDVLVDELADLRNTVGSAINKLTDPREADYLTRRYLIGSSVRDIAREENYSRRRVEQILKDGVTHLEALLA